MTDTNELTICPTCGGSRGEDIAGRWFNCPTCYGTGKQAATHTDSVDAKFAAVEREYAMHATDTNELRALHEAATSSEGVKRDLSVMIDGAHGYDAEADAIAAHIDRQDAVIAALADYDCRSLRENNVCILQQQNDNQRAVIAALIEAGNANDEAATEMEDAHFQHALIRGCDRCRTKLVHRRGKSAAWREAVERMEEGL